MKTVLLFILILTSSVVHANPYNWQITRIIDGDTVAVRAAWLPDPLKKELSIRVWGVDTPEKGHRAKCARENELGKAATQYTQSILNTSTSIRIVVRDWDKYGGRLLGDVLVDGRSLREL
jgi:endonuclease YncB( thermonuclease family)